MPPDEGQWSGQWGVRCASALGLSAYLVTVGAFLSAASWRTAQDRAYATKSRVAQIRKDLYAHGKKTGRD